MSHDDNGSSGYPRFSEYGAGAVVGGGLLYSRRSPPSEFCHGERRPRIVNSKGQTMVVTTIYVTRHAVCTVASWLSLDTPRMVLMLSPSSESAILSTPQLANTIPILHLPPIFLRIHHWPHMASSSLTSLPLHWLS